MFLKESLLVATLFGIFLLLFTYHTSANEMYDTFGIVDETNPNKTSVNVISDYQVQYKCEWQFDSISIVEKDYRRTNEEKEVLLNKDDACILLRRIIRNTDWSN